jgi:hypothetical protein
MQATTASNKHRTGENQMSQVQAMVEAGKKCKAEYSHRASGGQVFDELPLTCLDKDGKPTTKKALELIAAWQVGFVGGDIPKGCRIQVSHHGAGKKSVQVFDKNGKLVGDYNV